MTHPQQIFNLHGDNARVNIHSNDSSTNTVNNNSTEMFDGLLKLIKEQIEDAKARESLIASVEAMRQTQGLIGFKDNYLKFISIHTNTFRHFKPWEEFQVGDFKITPYLVDHSANGAYAFLVEAEGKRVHPSKAPD